MSAPDVTTATAAVREALGVLERASSDWRNGNARIAGPVHWTAALPAAWDALRRALQALEAAEAAPVGKFASEPVLPATPAARCACGRPHCPGDCLDSLGWEEHPDAREGMRWYNGISEAERRHWHALARSAVPADAWEAWKREDLAEVAEPAEPHDTRRTFQAGRPQP